VFYCQRCKAKRPREILPPVRICLFGYFTGENQINTRIKSTAIRKQTLCRVPCSKRALLEEAIVYISCVFKVLQSCGTSTACRKIVTNIFHHVQCVLSRSFRCGSQKQQQVCDAQVGLHNCNTFRNKTFINSKEFISIVTLVTIVSLYFQIRK